MYLTQVIVCSIFLNLIECQNWRERHPSVRVQQGLLEGSRIITDTGKTVNAFLGIPYAAPPTGDLRFAPPLKHPPWNETRQATSFAPHCPQLPPKPGINDQEDCLYLNVWSPENAGLYAPLPVVVFFEGRNFYQSSEFPINGQDLATEGLVVVTLNYRLNVFGFFCLGSAEARGNLGLLDQYFALVWIRQNINQFGGDPEKITLYGHQSGAVSVTFHMVSPRTAGFFQRVIISSGSAVATWQEKNDPVVASKQILRMLGCDAYTVQPIKCLRSKKVEHILQALAEYSESFNWNDRFLPVVDTFLPENNRYLPLNPTNALKEGTDWQVPVLTGISKPITDEQFMQWLELASQGFTQLQQYVEKVKIPEIARLYKLGASNKDHIYDLIRWQYFSSNQGDVRLLYDELKDFEFQAKVEAPHFLQLSHLISSYVQPIYVYFMDDVGFVLNTTDSTITTDLLLVFGPILLKQVARRRFNANEMNLSRQIKQLWTNFIMFGEPTLNNQVRSWRKYTSGDYYIENFGPVNSHINEENKKRVQRVLFWNQLVPKMANIKNNLSNNIPRELQNSPDPAAGFRHAMYTLVALVIALLALLLICIVLLKKRSRERENHLHMGY
ncbi:pyrethroid hydrolase Ces2a isoform X1 [Tribolium castaneum]|uniref:Carboxylesterase 4A-like Protein n=1 Tax=Tribolium castaneum TaxID=7070 RepID=D6W7F9_TRICA|nr:PREDICTED: carboxylesterase 4A isoform X1 [Tribolium castaneum]EFA11201.1 Carboxylesterase 4A-like Protein [Tribolium castaneum]|eukprot:XP_008199778.1 PREDICTED: carboxylesterase 4A isoform X1 [Tribolium castaneum]